MAAVRLGRPTFVRDTALSLLFGAAGGLVVAAVVALAGFPEWGQTLTGFMVVFSSMLPLGLAFRLLLHAGFEYVNHGMDPSEDMPRAVYLAYSRPVLLFGAGSVGAAAVLALTLRLGTGTAWPF